MRARILIIEDDAASRELARYLLDAAGYAVVTASDGGTGVKLAMSEQPDLVLCDLHLPVMDGFEVVQHLLGDKQWRRVPIVALTASSMVGDREKNPRGRLRRLPLEAHHSGDLRSRDRGLLTTES